jgi:hypothetical protein
LNEFFELLYEAFLGKTYGIIMQDVYASSTQQIVVELKFDVNGGMFCAGRVSRYGSKFLEGAVTCLDKEDLPLLHHSLTDLTRPFEVMNNTCMRASPNNKGLILLFVNYDFLYAN